MIPRFPFRSSFAALALALTPALASAQQAEHVVLVVWSGLRPDSVTETLTPTLFRLAQEGTRFSHHHAVYPTTPLVNGVTLLTGAYPGRSGIFADKFYLPALDPAKAVGAATPAAIQMGDALSNGHYLTVATLPELLQAGDKTTAVVGAGLLPLLADRRPEEGRTDGSSVVYAATIPGAGSSDPNAPLPMKTVTIPAALGKTLDTLLKPLPPTSTTPNLIHDRWMTRALINGLWKKEVPALSVLWLTDPAHSERNDGLGGTASITALRAQDENLRLILQALEAKGIRGKTDLFIVSDTGYSTVGEGVDIAGELSKVGFNATRQHKSKVTSENAENTVLKKGEVRVVGNGGTVLLYVGEHDDEVTARVLKFLQRSRYAGVIFSREARDGAFTLHQANMATGDWESLPDLVLSFRWTAEANKRGIPGTAVVDAPGGAVEKISSCGTLSRFDLQGTLIASGPDIRSGWVDDLPTGNADLAPTIAGLLRLASPPWMDGRVLVEAVRDYPAAQYAVDTETLTAAIGAWKQSLRISRINGAFYIEEGNASGAGRGGVGEP